MATDADAGFGSALPAAVLLRRSAQLQRRRYAKGEVIFLQGEPGTCLYLVAAGQVKIALTSAEGDEVELARLGPGEFFGELALLDGEPRSADAIATAPTELLLLPRADFLRLLDAQPALVRPLLTLVSRRLRQDVAVAHDVAFLEVPARLAKVLLQLAAQGQPNDDGIVIARLTQTELAGMVGATRESVNKWLGCFARQGLIRHQRGEITVLQPQGLRRCLTDGPSDGPTAARRRG
jgi:CRP-like cAMP-binding protein